MLPKFLARELEDDSPYQDGREDDVTPNASSGCELFLCAERPPVFELVKCSNKFRGRSSTTGNHQKADNGHCDIGLPTHRDT